MTSAGVSTNGDPPSSTSSRTILVTGFGPFGEHLINASWVAVGHLSQLWDQRTPQWKPYSLATQEVPVVYSYVEGSLPKIYEEHTPCLCVHVGVSPYTTVTLERSGRNSIYKHPDINGDVPTTGCCMNDGADCISTQFDLERIHKALSGSEIEFSISEDAGRYLCDFIYYKSLHMSKCPVLFVHVPPLNKPYSGEQLGKALKDLLEVLLSQMSRKVKKSTVV